MIDYTPLTRFIWYWVELEEQAIDGLPGADQRMRHLHRSAIQAALACAQLGGTPLGWQIPESRDRAPEKLLDFNPGPGGLTYGLLFRGGEFSVHS